MYTVICSTARYTSYNENVAANSARQLAKWYGKDALVYAGEHFNNSKLVAVYPAKLNRY